MIRDTLITYRGSNYIIKTYTQQFKEETVTLVTDQGYTMIKAAGVVAVRPNQIYNWKHRIADETTDTSLTDEDRDEFLNSENARKPCLSLSIV